MAVNVPGRLGRLIEECGTLVQVALDLTSTYQALRIGKSALVARNIILEAGTPLIKSQGAHVVEVLRALDPPAVVADMKTFDTGALEVEIAARAGADATTVLALAGEETIREAAREAEARGIALIVDLINHPEPLEAARMAARLGAHIILFHIGVDTQRRFNMTAIELLGLVSRLKQEVEGVPVAVAGGIKPGQAGEAARAGADIVVIGGGITKARDPREAALEAVRSVRPTCL